MKKNILRLVAVMIVMVMAVTAAAGCNREPESLYEPPEFVFVPESVELPGDIGDINRLVYSEGVLYMVVVNYEQGDATNNYSYYNSAEIYSMNIDGTGLSKLTGYTPPVEVPPDANGGIYINTMNVDSSGNLWVIENWNFSAYDLPDDFNSETDEPWQYQVDLGNGTAVRKLDTTGAELISVELGDISKQREYFYVKTFAVDSSDNIYIAIDDVEKGGMIIYVLDNAGKMQFELNTERWINQLIQLPDGSVAFATEVYDDVNYSRVLQTIDFNAKAFGGTVDLPNVGWEVFPGSGEYDVLINDSNNIYGYKIGEEDAVKLLNWMESDIVNNGIQNIAMISDEQIICTNSNFDRITYESSYELLVLTKTPYSELPQKTVLTLATFYMGNMRDAVVTFNRTNPDYRIHVVDYSEFNSEDDWTAGITRLSTELISGKIPDILDVSNLPYKEYVARGLLADLYGFIDSDPDYSRSDFVDGAFKAAEIDGSLYQVFPTFYVNTLAGHPSVVGSSEGWNMDEFKAVLDDHPDADMPLGQWLTKTTFLQAAVSFGIDEYIDWATGNVSFDTPDFIQLLEFANTFPDDHDWENMGRGGQNWEDIYVPEEEAIATGRQIMVQMTVMDFFNYNWYKAMFGGELVFKGFPNESRKGNSLSVDSGLAIIESSPNKDAAWSFVRAILAEEWQRSNVWAFPTNQAAFDKKVEEALAQDYENDYGYGMASPVTRAASSIDGGMITIAQPQPENLKQEDIDKIAGLISSASGTAGWNIDQTIWAIISEGVADYFSGVSSAQDVARVIQSRVQILVSERS